MVGMKKYVLDDKSEVVVELLTRYAQNNVVEAGKKGWNILCPFHADSKPSCLVFPTGVFTCLGCGKAWPPYVGFRKMGVPDHIIAQYWGRDAKVDVGRLKPLPSLDQIYVDESAPQEVEETYGVYQRDPWPEGWAFRDVSANLLSEPSSPLVRLFSPTLVRIWSQRGAVRVAERFPRIGLRMAHPSHEVYLRLSSQQERKIYNSCGLDQKDPDLLPFGLSSWNLPEGTRGIILVEGPYDLLRTSQNLLQMGRMWYDRITVVALLGVGQWGSFRDKFELRLLPQFSRGDLKLILALDNDGGGEILTRQILREVVEERFWLPSSMVSVLDYAADDPGVLDFEPFKEALLKNRF